MKPKFGPTAALRTGFDIGHVKCDKQGVNAVKRAPQKKTQGTLAVEKHRPLMNKLTRAQRRRLRHRAAELLYGREALAPGR
jgi:hypothetical protein